ncbi:MAG: polymer-forming cytoskeletal protein [Chitinispirillia bacterium]|nr:polymer-forming cytoskeletal protein [Chitinispirillia bacterium]MCL2241884.1 polymer-forming cytoskeletal protein [Chitinispirillia bacterium]
MEKNGKGLLNIIGAGSVFEGTINVPHSIRIDGLFKGKLQTAESVTVGEAGVVEAEVKAQNAFIFGKILGNVYIEDRVELHSSAVVVGDLHAKELVIKEGAVYHGSCSMQRGKEATVESTIA